jgi:hypothetical protein
MDEDDAYATIPADPELAFLHLEKHFKDVLDAQIDRAGNDGPNNVVYVEYISKVLAAIAELGLQTAVVNQQIPSIEDVNYQTYQNFSKDVEHYKTALKIRNGRRIQGYSVQLNLATRQKLSYHIEQLRDIFLKLEVDEKKREALLSRLAELQKEVDRDRTQFESYAALVMEIADTTGEAIERSRVRSLLDSIGRVIWGAKKEEEELRRLPPRTAPKQIEPPKVPQVPSRKAGNSDDEIPF